MTIVLACDRTGGHVYPAKILAEYIRREYPLVRIVFYGLRTAEADLLRDAGYETFGSELAYKNIVLESAVRFFEALYILLFLRPQRVVGFGGRCGVPLMLLASLCMPTALYEPNAVYGKANQILALLARKVFLGIVPESRAKELRTGVPIRRNFFDRCHDRVLVLKGLNLDPGAKTVLIFGGSSGARTINRTACDMISRFPTKGMQFIHVTGPSDYEEVRHAYIRTQVPAVVFPYFEDMSMLYSVCDAVVSRSGASSMAEIAYVKKPAVFVPYPYAHAHQSVNAAVVSGVRYVKIFEQDVLTPELLKTALEGFIAEGAKTVEYPRIWTEPDTFAKMVCDEVMGGMNKK